MTCHRLVRCRADQLIGQVAHRHPGSAPDASTAEVLGVTPWLPPTSRRPRLAWRQQLPGNRSLGCCLVIEQAANGVLAHLSAAPTSGARWPLPARAYRLGVELWAAHE